MRNFYIDGTSSATYNIYASGENAYNAAERDVEKISIAGRNGDLIVDNGRFKNIDVKYPCVVPYGFLSNAASIRNWFASHSMTYHKITDDYDASHYRMGKYKGVTEFDPMYTNQAAATFNVVFDCKPQRFLNSGDTATTVASGRTITNPTNFPSYPELTINGARSGARLTVNGKTIAFTGNFTGTIDCETGNAVQNGQPANNLISCTDFPTLKSGSNTVSWSGTITSVSIKGRWWEL